MKSNSDEDLISSTDLCSCEFYWRNSFAKLLECLLLKGEKEELFIKPLFELFSLLKTLQ